MQGYAVEHEQIIGHKKVDLLARSTTFGKECLTAVECKDYGKAVDAEEVKTIYVDYSALIDSGIITDILLVTRSGVTPSALTFIQSKNNYYHRTLDELFTSIINFGPYLGGLIHNYQASGLPNYYVDPITTEGEIAEHLIFRWFEEDFADPLAILAGYGMGKTTLANHLAYVLAEIYFKKQSGRIPILVRLFEIAKEQSLEGLLGKLFTAHNRTPGYSFEGWMALNRAGKFVVIFDGFDEMKYMISKDEFSYNFAEFSRLVHPQSKVIILGRPTAFLSEDEYQELLRGKKAVLTHAISLGNSVKYREVSLAPFSGPQVRRFLERYVPHRLNSDSSLGTRERRLSLDKLRLVSNKTLADIAQRPVQLKMLAEVLPTFKGNINRLTLAGLYDQFIDEIIKRESGKLTRRSLGISDRRLFARRLALYMWNDGGKRTINAHDIPAELIDSVVPKGLHDIEAVRRDLVSACFLEGKAGGQLYFPHRSFQEFLVAEEIVDQLAKGKRDIRVLDDSTNEEVAGFIKELVGHGTIEIWRKQLFALRVPVSLRMISVLSHGLDVDRIIDILEDQSKDRWNSWYLLFLIGMLRRSRIAISNIRGRRFFTLIERLRHATTDEHQLGLLLFALTSIIGKMGGPSTRKQSHFMEVYLSALLDSLSCCFGIGTRSMDVKFAFEELFYEIKKVPSQSLSVKIARYERLAAVLAAHQISWTTRTLDVRQMYIPLCNLLESGPFIVEALPLRTGAQKESVECIEIGSLGAAAEWLKKIVSLIPIDSTRALKHVAR
jgi:hypothetical protein